jgi:hypothetical protein
MRVLTGARDLRETFAVALHQKQAFQRRMAHHFGVMSRHKYLPSPGGLFQVAHQPPDERRVQVAVRLLDNQQTRLREVERNNESYQHNRTVRKMIAG